MPFFGKGHKEPKLNPQQCLFGHHLLPVHLQHITVSGNNVLYEVLSQWLHLDLRQLWISLFLSKFGFLSSSFFRSWRALGFVNLMELRISRYYRYWNPHSKAESLMYWSCTVMALVCFCFWFVSVTQTAISICGKRTWVIAVIRRPNVWHHSDCLNVIWKRHHETPCRLKGIFHWTCLLYYSICKMFP